MILQDVLENLITLPAPIANLEIAGMQLDSRQVKAGDLFIARQGCLTHGQAFIQQAIANGAVAVLTEDKSTELVSATPVPTIAVVALGQQLGALAAKFYQTTEVPAVLGVTGTNGKTSVSHYFAALMSALEVKTAVVGTVGNGIWPQVEASLLTTPDVLTQHANLALFRKAQVAWVAKEVSSHALVQNRIAGVPIKIAVFTNLTPEHLDYHGTMEAYGEAKAKLFRLPTLTHAIVNLDDPYAANIVEQLASTCELLTYSLAGKAEASLRVVDHDLTSSGIRAAIDTPWGEAHFTVPLLADFNLANLLASIASCVAAGVPFADVIAALPAVKPVRGRLEWLRSETSAQVVVDFAHTPDALERVLTNLRPLCAGKLWCIFGCGGDRDQQKRPLMGQVAAKLADRVILTSDNPRTESPTAIIDEISSGINDNCQCEVIADRKLAITYAIEHASSEDWLLIAGKGHEAYQEVNGQRLPFSDQEIVLLHCEERSVTSLRGA